MHEGREANSLKSNLAKNDLFFFSPLPSKLDLFPDPVDNMVSETVVMAQGLA